VIGAPITYWFSLSSTQARAGVSARHADDVTDLHSEAGQQRSVVGGVTEGEDPTVGAG
jgi:hypothetical protein